MTIGVQLLLLALVGIIWLTFGRQAAAAHLLGYGASALFGALTALEVVHGGSVMFVLVTLGSVGSRYLAERIIADMPPRHIYRCTGSGRWELAAMVIAVCYRANRTYFLVLSLMVVLLAILGRLAWEAGKSVGQSLFNSLPILALMIWLLYSYLFLVAFSVRIDGGTLYWRSAVRSGTAEVGQLISVSSRWPMNGVVFLRFSAGRSVIVKSGPGFGEFLKRIRTEYPGVHIGVSWIDRR